MTRFVPGQHGWRNPRNRFEGNRFPNPSDVMLLTLLVICYARPFLRDKARRERVLSILLIGTCLAFGDGRLSSVQAGDPNRWGTSAPDQHDADPQRESISHSGQQYVREGTLIPATVGRVINLGRRWAFIPRTEDSVSPRQQTSATPDLRQPATSPISAPTPAIVPGHQHIILCENQLLQRIVEATRADATDDRWEISGEILEFFDENRLLILTVQRTNSHESNAKLHVEQRP